MTPEQQQQLRIIQQRWALTPYRPPFKTCKDDIDFLLFLVKSQQVLASELALIVDVGTCDDPGTALSKLHKIQHVVATRMRDACVEKVRSKAQFFYSKGFASWASAFNELAHELESVSIQEQEAKEP